MIRNYLAEPVHAVRRKDRAVDDDAWIAEFLRRAPMGTLATVSEGQPFINSNLFVYDEEQHAIYMHTARHGRTRANIDAGERACFSVTEMGRLLPAPKAFNMSVEYDGVVAFGSARVIDDPAEQRRGLHLLLAKYFPHLRPGDDYLDITPEELSLTAVYRIDIEAWSGKRKRVEDDYAGAFMYADREATR